MSATFYGYGGISEVQLSISIPNQNEGTHVKDRLIVAIHRDHW